MKRSGDDDICTVMIATNERASESFRSILHLPLSSCAAYSTYIFPPPRSRLRYRRSHSLTHSLTHSLLSRTLRERGKVRKGKSFPGGTGMMLLEPHGATTKISLQHGVVRRLRDFGHMISYLDLGRTSKRKEW